MELLQEQQMELQEQQMELQEEQMGLEQLPWGEEVHCLVVVVVVE